MKEKKVIGVLGGMGPEATEYFFRLIFKNTAAVRDQEHAPVLIWNDPRIPPRTEAILGRGPSPLPGLLAGIKVLERGGAGMIVVPCLSAHFWAREIRAAARVPFIDLVEETAKASKKLVPGLKKAGLLGSTGTVRSGIFHRPFARRGLELVTPDDRGQERVMDAVFGLAGAKAGFTAGASRRMLLSVSRELVSRGAEAIIAGCTEVPLLLREDDLPVPLIDPMAAGARVCLAKAGFPLKA